MKNKKLANLLAFKANLFEVFVIAVLVSLGVNILASGFLAHLNLDSTQSLIIGGLLVVTGLLILLRNLQPENSRIYEFNGVICTDRNSSELISIQNYEVTEELKQAISALCTENKAFKKIWSESPIGLGMSFENGRAISKRPKSNAILLEAIEYFTLNQLSLHLSSHFNNNSSVSDDELVTIERKNIPQVLLDNRFFDLFSRPMEEREHFIEHGGGSEDGKVVYAFGKGGAMFNHFEMVLPKGSSISREQDSSLVIKTPRFELKIKPNFIGVNANLPRNFEQLYMGRDLRSVSTFHIGLSLTVDFSAKSLFSVQGWDYYWWLDSFLNRIENEFSKNKFLTKISWDQNAAMMLMAENRRKKQERDLKVREEKG